MLMALHLDVTTSAPSESLLKYTCPLSQESMRTVGTEPVTWTVKLGEAVSSREETSVSSRRDVF